MKEHVRHGPRRTAQKEAVRRALGSMPGFVSAQELQQRLGSDGAAVGLATVYRQLKALVDSGEADVVSAAGGQLFRACGPGAHHHHLICENCGTAVEIAPPDEDWFTRIAAEHGFTVTRHDMEVFGRCPRCHLS